MLHLLSLRPSSLTYVNSLTLSPYLPRQNTNIQSQYINRKPLRQKPTAHISYHEGLRLIRQFLTYASQHTVEDVQAFTAQWVPCPTWVLMDEIAIPDPFITRAADIVASQLGPHGLEVVGGKEWWQWRRPEKPLHAEWIEMKSDANERKAKAKKKADRIILYIHGGAYYFGSTGEHRYQMQRHARKLKAQLLAPKYRLAPQFPFPCGLHDCVATYLYLIQDHDPNTIILGGDSAGGGMVIALLVTLRDQNIPLPAGAIQLSPWVDLTHSFPSVAGDGELDYIPAMGFHHKPSAAWPPPNAADLEELSTTAPSPSQINKTEPIPKADAAQGFSATDASTEPPLPHDSGVPKPGQNLSIDLDGKLIEIQDQIQMYAANHLLSHPLVSPVMQPSLGGLPPLLIQVGGGELLRDEQIYLAHKAAHPHKYPPPDAVTREWDPENKILNKYGPTQVQLQVWDDLCHVAHTLSFTRPAKYMYRGVAQFGAWALAHAQDKPMTILDDDEISIISTESASEQDSKEAEPSLDGSTEPQSASAVPMQAHTFTTSDGAVGKAGDPLPPFVDHMIRQRVDRHGNIYPLAAPSELPALNVDRNSIGVIKPGPVRKWITKKSEWDTRYAKEKRRVQKTRLKEMASGYDAFAGETPPPTALAGRRQKGMEKERKQGKSWGLAMWTGWGSKHDESTIERKKKFGRRATQSVVLPEAGAGVAATTEPEKVIAEAEENGELASTASTIPANEPSASNVPASAAAPEHSGYDKEIGGGVMAATGAGATVGAGVYAAHESDKVEGSENTYLSPNSTRPHNGTVAYPFKLRNMQDSSAASTATLDDADGVRPMDEQTFETGFVAGLAREDGGGGEVSHPPGKWVDGSLDEDEGGKGDDGAANGKGYTIGGGPAWIAGGSSVSGDETKVQNTAAPADGDAGTAKTGGSEGTEIGGHNWITGSSPKADEGEGESAERPALNHFVTARESL